MRPRPRQSRARGLLRAAAVVIVLTILLVIAIVVISSLTAPTAKAPGQATPIPTAPTHPASPGPLRGTSTPVPKPTSKPGKHPTAVPRVTPTKTHTAKKDIAFGPVGSTGRVQDEFLLDDRRPDIKAPVWFARFGAGGDAYTGRVLSIIDRDSGQRILVGRADQYVTPVWFSSWRGLLYVRAEQTGRYPGSSWTLLSFDRLTRHSQSLATARGMGLWPLGWAHHSIYYVLANDTDTSIFRVSGGRSRFVSILVPQPVSLPRLSPKGQFISYVTPSDCSYCTLAIFDLDRLTTWNGPTGIPDERDTAWTPDGRTLVVRLDGNLAAIDASTHDVRLFRLPLKLPLKWQHPMTALFDDHALDLVDSVTARMYRSPPPAID